MRVIYSLIFSFLVSFSLFAQHAETESFKATLSACFDTQPESDHRMIYTQYPSAKACSLSLFSWNLCDLIKLCAFPEKGLFYGTGGFKETPLPGAFFTYLKSETQDERSWVLESEDALKARLIRALDLLCVALRFRGSAAPPLIYLQEATYLTEAIFQERFHEGYKLLRDEEQGLCFIYRESDWAFVETGEELLKEVKFPDTYIRQVVLTVNREGKKILHINTHHTFFDTAIQYQESVTALKQLYDLGVYDEIITGGDWNVTVKDLEEVMKNEFGEKVVAGYDLKKGTGNAPLFMPDEASRKKLEGLSTEKNLTAFAQKTIQQILSQQYHVHDFPVDGFFGFVRNFS